MLPAQLFDHLLIERSSLRGQQNHVCRFGHAAPEPASTASTTGSTLITIPVRRRKDDHPLDDVCLGPVAQIVQLHISPGRRRWLSSTGFDPDTQRRSPETGSKRQTASRITRHSSSRDSASAARSLGAAAGCPPASPSAGAASAFLRRGTTIGGGAVGLVVFSRSKRRFLLFQMRPVACRTS